MTDRRRENPQPTWSQAKQDARVLTRDAEWAAGWIAKARAACHPKQLPFVDDESIWVTALCSRGAGKTTGAIVRLLKTMGSRRKTPCAFIATTRTFAKKIIWSHLKNIIEKLGIDARFNETELTMTMVANGSTLEIVGADDLAEVDKLRGRPFAGVVIDEAASHPPALLEYMIEQAIAPRLGELDGWLALIGTPGRYLAGVFYDATRPGSEWHRPFGTSEEGWLGWSSHHWNLKDGAEHVPAMAKLWARALLKKDEKHWSDAHPIWKREYLGLWAADDTDNIFKYRPHLDDGSEWNVWDPEREGPFGLAKLPEGFEDWEHVYSLDQGHADPLALNIWAFSPSDPGKFIYHRYCFEKQALYAKPVAQMLIGEKLDASSPAGLIGITGWPAAFVGDADLTFLAELANVYGIRIKQAIRHRERKFGAIELANGDLVEGRIKILRGSKLEEQVMSLQWQESDTGELRENKAQANHSSDCMVYGRLEIAILFETGVVEDRSAAPKEGAPPGRKPQKRPVANNDPDPVQASEVANDWTDLLASGTYDGDPW